LSKTKNDSISGLRFPASPSCIKYDISITSLAFKALPWASLPNKRSTPPLYPVLYVNSFEHDAKGHKTRHRTSGFKLPQTDAEVELESIKSRLDDLEFQD
jgi:hypothetical protein